MVSALRASETTALLPATEHLGTLEAASCLGGRGVHVVVASSRWLAPARLSRSVARVLHSPSAFDEDAMLGWLIQYGVRAPGAVLHPTSDEMACLIARNAELLGRIYALYTAPFDAVRTVLDKRALHDAARAAGMLVPETFFPNGEREVAALAREGRALVVKARSHVSDARLGAAIVEGPEQAVAVWRSYRRLSSAPPVLQELVRGDAGVYSLTGFMTPSGRVLAARASQRSFVAPVDHVVLDDLGRLARRIGIFGAFEAELVGSTRQLIDFSPRCAPLAWLVHLAALGENDALGAEADAHAAPAIWRALRSLTRRTSRRPARDRSSRSRAAP